MVLGHCGRCCTNLRCPVPGEMPPRQTEEAPGERPGHTCVISELRELVSEGSEDALKGLCVGFSEDLVIL